MASLHSKQKPPTAAVPPLICIGALCIGKRFALIRSQGTLRCQDSSPNQALASRSTDTTATNHIGECPRKQLVVFCKKILCKSVQKGIVSLPNGGPPRDSQTGWFPRNLWPPKCQFRSWKFQFKLKLSHGVIVVETKKLQQQLFHLQSALGLYVLENVFCIRRNLKVSRQFSKPRPCFTIHRHHGNQSRRESPRTQLIVFCQKILCKSVQKAIFSRPKGRPPT